MFTIGAHSQSTQQRRFFIGSLCLGILCSALVTTETLQAQVFAVPVPVGGGAVDAGDTTSSPHKMPGFSISVDEKKLNLLDDYERYIRHQMWEKALTALKELSETKSTSPLLPTKDGFLVDAEQRIFMALVSMPAEGREAFRLFFDGKAKKQFEDLSAQNGLLTSDRITKAKQIYSQYFLTSIGDDVADLLGNDAFERGEFVPAARFWRSILDHHPDTNLSEIDLNVKYALALIRSRQTEQAAATIQVISQQFPGKKIRLGGEDVDPVPYLQALTPRGAETPSAAAPQHHQLANLLQQPLKLPQEKVKPQWQLSYLDKTMVQAIENSRRNYYGRGKSYETFVPPMAVDEKRAYFNFYGVCFGVDLQTGKLVWRTDKFQDLGTHFSNYSFHQSSNPAQYQITVANDIVLATLIPKKEMNHYRARYRLYAYNGATGKQLWTSNVSNESYLSKPLVEGGHVYVVSHLQNNKSLTLNCLSLKTGKKEWSLKLGAAVSTSNSNGREKMPIPLLQKEGDNLLVLTNNGALFEISIPTKSINWVFRYPYKVNQSNTHYYYAAVPEETELHSEGQIFRDQNLVYFKEAGADEVYALNLAEKRLVWKRPIKKSAQIVGLDQKNVYLLSKELEALDRKSHRLNWAVSLPVAAGGLSALVAPEEAWVFTSRGIFEISKTNGDILNIYRGSDKTSLGGAIALRKGLVICVSNQAVTAYPTAKPAKSLPTSGNEKSGP
ncbi:outer membrane biogenesis protein BamB [Gimesia alba]|uniref:Outer membrane biogenesis protein BamB n=1 Tax=Gimesia alba TaxID=2527973 RepID=A0A517RG32_9PLAN|nr:PQQ-binding-like beta-propeller repeat protein [Gimesia alba]QDT42805.1 outer membrane biogenesis protein BamB [Gimesia alba]